MSAFRDAVRGRTYNCTKETRGRKRSLSHRAVLAIDRKRKDLVLKAKGEKEVTWAETIKKARVKQVDPTTAKRSLVRAGIPVARRRPREKPQRKSEHIEERTEITRRWRYYPNDYFSKNVDLIWDMKHWDAPTTKEARSFKNKMKVRFQNRTPDEGLLPQYTKPNNITRRISHTNVMCVRKASQKKET